MPENERQELLGKTGRHSGNWNPDLYRVKVFRKCSIKNLRDVFGNIQVGLEPPETATGPTVGPTRGLIGTPEERCFHAVLGCQNRPRSLPYILSLFAVLIA